MFKVVFIIGSRGSGKSTVRTFFEQAGFLGSSQEAKYLKYAGCSTRRTSKMRDAVYEEAYREIRNLISNGNVVYELTGTDKRWPILKDRIAKSHKVYSVKVDCPANVALKRVLARGWDNLARSSEKELYRIQFRSFILPSDFIIDNSGSLKDTQKQVMEIIRRIND